MLGTFLALSTREFPFLFSSQVCLVLTTETRPPTPPFVPHLVHGRLHLASSKAANTGTHSEKFHEMLSAFEQIACACLLIFVYACVDSCA